MLELTEPIKNLGTIKFGQPKIFTVGIKNPSPNDVYINSIGVGCGSCTKAVMVSGNNLIKAGATEQLQVTYTPNSTGYTPKTVTINNFLVFNFNATVVQ